MEVQEGLLAFPTSSEASHKMLMGKALPVPGDRGEQRMRNRRIVLFVC